MQNKGLLLPDVEELYLEELQGANGLHALRVSVAADVSLAPKGFQYFSKLVPALEGHPANLKSLSQA
ncbi:MAG: hypothetical protein HC913_08490 [Microscillaceae bacterium]|nr:hypothetical protein [Microscillaceae bacterium]